MLRDRSPIVIAGLDPPARPKPDGQAIISRFGVAEARQSMRRCWPNRWLRRQI